MNQDSQSWLGPLPLQPPASNKELQEEFVEIDGQSYYCLVNYDKMPPFFMTIVSPDDHWLFVGSNGGLSAGRRSPDQALFPYYTDDKILAQSELSGPRCLLRAKEGGHFWWWEAFSARQEGLYAVERRLYKSSLGNSLIFEERLPALGLRYRYQWRFSQTYGLVKRNEIFNEGLEPRQIELLEGLQNLLPSGIDRAMQDQRSTLADAYKSGELSPEGLGIFSLSAMIIDRAEASESLQATTVWGLGLEAKTQLLSDRQLENFRRGYPLHAEPESKGQACSYYQTGELVLEPSTSHIWYTVAELEQSAAQVVALQGQLRSPQALLEALQADIADGDRRLKKIVGQSDGLQSLGQNKVALRHYNNALMNSMRGGLFTEAYRLDREDFSYYLKRYFPRLARQYQQDLPEKLDYAALLAWAKRQAAPDLLRASREYLPLSFSRRHGDPSRPWNHFSIELQERSGKKIYRYEGNWRDIFQNWEALAYSYPRYIEGMISRFVNASTIDGYNPYRITKEGIDWEVIEAHDPWSNIGYWGDHQIIYLLKLLEHAHAHEGEKLIALLSEESFVYAAVPYRLRSFEASLADPKNTVDYDHAWAAEIAQREAEWGSEARLIQRKGELLRCNLLEKLLVPILTKLYNYVPEGGIWLNTQRPEWNDANNALVGQGLSMVTVAYLHRYLRFLQKLLAEAPASFRLHEPVVRLLRDLRPALAEMAAQGKSSPTQKALWLRQMGLAGEAYREKAYAGQFEQQVSLERAELLEFLALSQQSLAQSLTQSRQPQGLYAAYQLARFDQEALQIEPLYDMLEGQVAVLSAGLLSPTEALTLLDRLRSSALYREDQYSYLLYPYRQLPSFVDRAKIPAGRLAGHRLAQKLIAEKQNHLLERDPSGQYYFGPSLHAAPDLEKGLALLAQAGWQEAQGPEAESLLALFEECFQHHAFTGRSGSFYAYEGLGSIYWHMVSKLLLAVQEQLWQARDAGAEAALIGRLTDHYYQIRAGIGVNKSPELYGAFPTDPYSHTPLYAGAQQPGMTGQVKEDLLSRWGELGLRVRQGLLELDPFLLDPKEFCAHGGEFEYYDAQGCWKTTRYEAGELLFTYCGVLFRYRQSAQNNLVLYRQGQLVYQSEALKVNQEWSHSLFERRGEIEEIRLHWQR